MECGEIDFSQLLDQQKGKRLNMNFVGLFWLQVSTLSVPFPPPFPRLTFIADILLRKMLECVQVLHDRQIIHTDLKPANFVLVKGTLKIIDFGISHEIVGDTVHVRRDNQVRFSFLSLFQLV